MTVLKQIHAEGNQRLEQATGQAIKQVTRYITRRPQAGYRQATDRPQIRSYGKSQTCHRQAIYMPQGRPQSRPQGRLKERSQGRTLGRRRAGHRAGHKAGHRAG